MAKGLVSMFGLLLVMTIASLAADVSGKWVGTVQGGGQGRETTFVFKVDGEKLTGTVSDAQGGSINIADGKVSGDTISFSVTTERGKRTFTGAVSGAEIKFKREGGQNPSEFVAKRAGS